MAPIKLAGSIQRIYLLVCFAIGLSACANPPKAPPVFALTQAPASATPTSTSTQTVQPTRDPGFMLLPMESTTEETPFASFDGVKLAGQFDWPLEGEKFDLVFIIHHADPVTRDNYQFLAARLVPLGYVVFRFDKRGTGGSEGEYGCCEAEDALAAYRAAVNAHPEKIGQVFIIAQSIGTQHLASQFDAFQAIQQPAGVLLLSCILPVEEVLKIQAPIRIVMSDSEPDQIAESEAAVQAHQEQYPYGASLVIAENTEHTLFDLSQGTIDWKDPAWPEKFSGQAWESIRKWLEERRSH
jgi:alpha/beta superfamily hydrolase